MRHVNKITQQKQFKTEKYGEIANFSGGGGTRNM